MTAQVEARSPGLGFTETVFASQRTFRAILDAMARPGTIASLPDALSPPMPLTPGTAAICLTLLDYDTPVWLAPEFVTAPVTDYLRFHCGCPLATEPEDARFAICATEPAPFASLPAGTADYPDRSATLIRQVGELRRQGSVSLSGPGIDETRSAGVSGVSAGFWRERAEACAAFPCGIDMFLTADNQVMAVPRTTRVEI